MINYQAKNATITVPNCNVASVSIYIRIYIASKALSY